MCYQQSLLQQMPYPIAANRRTPQIHRSLKHSSSSLLSLQSYFQGTKTDQSLSDCAGYPCIYVAGLVNQFVPSDMGTKSNLFSFRLSSPLTHSSPQHIVTIYGAMIGFLIGILGEDIVVAFMCRQRKQIGREDKGTAKIEASSVSEFGLIHGKTNLVEYKFDEIKRAAMNFSRENLIGLEDMKKSIRGHYKMGQKL
ncbi:hypothetical protein TEA_014834 [Camellia sinensis var. sinensis]|uniref:Uncharacterized protein n=1 Tax=Camellia sinensis var. sinensis TaxID=542762 RepID=A0A4S4EF41_CAMSN|nr:hypothetical protein TEA_014834 [Camellia sinensis var. sinensis]